VKINIEVDVSPEEMRELMGLPELKGLHEAVLSQVSDRLKNSVEQGDAFAQTMLSGAVEPWKYFAKMMNNASPVPDKPSSRSTSKSGSKSKS
jgi:hypothetical protein